MTGGRPPLFEATVDHLLIDPDRLGAHHWRTEPRTEEFPAMTDPQGEPIAATAGEQDHSDPWVYAGDTADAPASTADDAACPGGDL